MFGEKAAEALTDMKQLYPQVETTKEFEKIVGDKEVKRGGHRHPGPPALRAGEEGAAGGEARLRREADAPDLRAGKRAGPDRGEEEADAHGWATPSIYSAPVNRIQEIVKSGDIGEIQYISSRRLNLGLFQKDINVAWDLAPHDISIILHLLGKPPVWSTARGRRTSTRRSRT